MNKIILITLLATIISALVLLSAENNQTLPIPNSHTKTIGGEQLATPEPANKILEKLGGKCPPGQKYIEYGAGISPESKCYTPTRDAGKVCYSSADCQAQCIADQNDPTIKSCNLELGPNHCPGASGKCGNGSEISGAFIDKKDHIILNLLD